LNWRFKNTAFLFLIGVAFFGGPFIWIITLATHMGFGARCAKKKREFVRFAPRAVEFGARTGGVAWRVVVDLVGAGLSRVAALRPAVAWLLDAVLLYLARVPKSQIGRWNDRK